MTRYLTVNRCLSDKAMDKIDHALGRPIDPLAETHREHYCVDKGSSEADIFRASPHWDAGEPSDLNQSLAWFYVNRAGREALAAHLKQIGDPYRAFIVRYGDDGEWEDRVVAKSASAARYRKFLDVRDAYPDLTFLEFCATARVRRAA